MEIIAASRCGYLKMRETENTFQNTDFFFFLEPHPWYMEVPGSGTEAGSFNPLHQARDRTCTSTVTRAIEVRFLIYCATKCTFFFFFFLSIPTA